jgi:hypothetical protein
MRGTWGTQVHWRGGPDGGDEGQAGEGVPLLGHVVVDEFFAGAFEAVGALFRASRAGSPMRMAASARASMASRSAAAGRKGTSGLPQLRKRMRAWATVVRLAVSAATERRAASGWLARRTSRSERTRPLEAMAQPGRMRRPGMVARRRWGPDRCRPRPRPGGRRTRRATCGRFDSAGRAAHREAGARSPTSGARD